MLSPTAFVAFDLPMTLDGAADANWVVTLWELRGKFPGRCEENPPCSSSLSSRGFPADRPTPTLEILRLSLLKWAVSPLQMPRQKRLAPHISPAFTGISGRDGKMKPARSGIMPVTMDLVLKWGTTGPSSRRASQQNHKHNPIPPKNQTWQWHIPMCK